MSAVRPTVSTWRTAAGQHIGRGLLKPPIATGPPLSCRVMSPRSHPDCVYEDQNAYAETSAAGAARFAHPRYPSFSGNIPQALLHASIDLSSGPSPPQGLRRYSTADAHRPGLGTRPLRSFNVRAPITAETWEMAKLRSSRKKLRYAGDIGWMTPAEITSGGPESDREHKEASVRSLDTDGDRELVGRSVFRHTFTPAYDAFIDLRAKIESIPEEEHSHLSNKLYSVIQAVLTSTEPSANPKEVQPLPVLPADAIALRILCKSIILTLIALRLPDEEILEVFRELRKRFRRLNLPQYHCIVASAGLHERDELVLALFSEAQQDWLGATDEWMLYARARALSKLGRASHVLDHYWTEYETCRAAPPAAYGQPVGKGTVERKMHPPRYLFIFLLQHQIASAAGPSGGRSFARTKELVRVMVSYGFQPDLTVYTALLGSSTSLSRRLPEVLDPTLYDTESQDQVLAETLGTGSATAFLRILRIAIEEYSIRDVFRLLDLSNVPRMASERVCDRPSTNPMFATPPIHAQLKAHVLMSGMFARLGITKAAHFHFEACWEHRGDASAHACVRTAAANVIKAYNMAGQPEMAMHFGLGLLDARSEDDQDCPIFVGDSNVYGRLLYSAAALPSLPDVIANSRNILERILSQGISQDESIRSGICALFHTALKQERDDLSELMSFFGRLTRLANPTNKSVETQTYVPADGRPWKDVHRDRLSRLLLHLKHQGFEDKFKIRLSEYVSSKRRQASCSERTQKARLSKERRQEEASSIFDSLSDDSQQISWRRDQARHSERRPQGKASSNIDSLPDDLSPEGANAALTSLPHELYQNFASSDEEQGPVGAAGCSGDRVGSQYQERDPSMEDGVHDEGGSRSAPRTGTDIPKEGSRAYRADLVHDEGSRSTLWTGPDIQTRRSRASQEDGVTDEETGSFVRDGTDVRPESSASEIGDDISLNEQLTSAGYAMRLRTLAVLHRDHDAAMHVYRTMERNSVEPSMLHIAPIVEGLCLDGRVYEAQSIASDARKSLGRETTARIESAIITGLIKEGRFTTAQREYESWVKAGGKPTPHLRHLSRDLDFPRLLREDELQSALRDAETRKVPLDLGEVDVAYRFLTARSRFVSALRLLLAAMLWTGTQPDYHLRKAVKASGSNIRKFLRQRGETVSQEIEGPEQPVISSRALKTQELLRTDPLLLPRSTIFFPRYPDRQVSALSSQNPEEQIEYLRLALTLQEHLLNLLPPLDDKVLVQHRRASRQFRQDLETLVLDIAGGRYSVSIQKELQEGKTSLLGYLVRNDSEGKQEKSQRKRRGVATVASDSTAAGGAASRRKKKRQRQRRSRETRRGESGKQDQQIESPMGASDVESQKVGSLVVK